MRPNNVRYNRFKEQDKFLVGNRIRSAKVRCIDSNNVNHGVISTRDALALAQEQGLDLVQISTNENSNEIPICKIVDFSKFKYEQSKKDKLAKKKQRENAIKMKEIKFRPSTDTNDLKIKAKHAQEFLNDGCKLVVTIVFKGRELAYKDVAKNTFDTFLSFLSNAKFESQPSLNGKYLTAVIVKTAEITTTKPKESVHSS